MFDKAWINFSASYQKEMSTKPMTTCTCKPKDAKQNIDR